MAASVDHGVVADGGGVPAFLVGDRLFWGLDSLPMLRACLEGTDPWFDGPAWDASAQVPSGLPGHAAGTASR